MEKLVERLEVAVSRLEAFNAAGFQPATSSENAPGAAPIDPSIVAYDDLVEKSLSRVSIAAEKIGGQVFDVTKIIGEAFSVQRDLLIKIKQSQKPDITSLNEFLKPLNEAIVKANALTEGRQTDFFNHLKTAADSLTALAWLAYTGKDCGMSLPAAHVDESWQMAEFYNNKVLVQYRNNDSNHVEWAKALKELYLPGLRDYVKSFHPQGPVSSITGNVAVSTFTPAPSTAAPSRAPTPSKATAPPPPPPASLFSSESAEESRSKLGMAAVFQEISTGESVTAGLRKVTADMKSKNRADRTGVVNSSGKEGSHTSSPSFSKAGPPKLELQMGRKWVVENQIGKENLVIGDCDSKQSVYVYGCKNSVLQVKGKVNNITIDKCTKMGIVFTDVVAACEIVNCNGVEVQCQGTSPTISVDNTSGCQLYLSKDSLGASITTAKSSEINVLVPNADADKDWMANRGNDSEVDGKKNMKWTQNMDKAFIEQLIRHGSELRINNGLTKEKWNAISTAISVELGFQLDVKHLKNHFKIWKSNYVQVRELRGLSGFEWDDKRKLVDAAESVWVDLIKAHPTMARWRYQTFPLYDDLAIIMGDAHATGDMSFTWNEPGFIDVGEGEDTPGSYNDQPPVVDVDGNNFTQADPNLPGSSYDEPSPTSTPTVDQGKKKKRKGVGDNISEALGSMVHSLSRMADNDAKKLEYFSKKDIEIGRMKDRILQFSGVDVNDRFKAMTLLAENDSLRSLFLSLDENLQLAWLMSYLGR